MSLQLTLILAVLFTAPALAQTPQGTVSGIVTDTTGAVLPGASVSAVRADTGQRTAAVTNDRGFFVLKIGRASCRERVEISVGDVRGKRQRQRRRVRHGTVHGTIE